MLGRRHTRIKSFSMLHACALMAMLVLAATLQTKMAPVSGAAMERAQIETAPHGVLLIRASVIRFFDCDETLGFDI